MLIAAREIFVT